MGRLIDRERRERARIARTERRATLLEAAVVAFLRRPPAEVSLDEVSRRAQVPESTARLLFASVDELFLEVLDRALREWCEALSTRLERCGAGGGRSAAARTLVAELARRPEMVGLIGHLPGVLERSVDVSTALAFLHRLDGYLQRPAHQLERLLRTSDEGEGAELLWRLVRVAAGTAPFARPTGAMAVALVDRDLARLRVEIADELGVLVDRLLPG